MSTDNVLQKILTNVSNTPVNVNIDSYYNRYNADNHYTFLYVRDGKGTQASEINEIQSINDARLKELFSGLYKDGDVVSGGVYNIDAETGHVTVQAGKVYMQGWVWDVPAAEFDIQLTGKFSLGVHLEEKIITEVEDPSLRNPAIGQRGEGEPGAWRKQVLPSWEIHGDDIATGVDFYQVYSISDAAPEVKNTSQLQEGFNQTLAVYDKDSTGSGTYVVEGLELTDAGVVEGKQVYSLSHGRARVNGAALDLATSSRFEYTPTPDLRYVPMETATATDRTGKGQRVLVAHPPIQDLVVQVTKEITKEVTHGPYAGASDDLGETGVTRIVQVTQGATTYTEGTDYTRIGDQLSWKNATKQPQSGSKYTVVFNAIFEVVPESQDQDGFTVVDAVPDSSIMYRYNQLLPRYDRLALDSDGKEKWFPGVATENNPQVPKVPNSLLVVATVYQNWRTGQLHQIKNDSTRVISFDEIADIKERLSYAFDEIMRQKLESNITSREGGIRTGIFVDSLTDDSLRDAGEQQTGAIVDGALMLPVGSEHLFSMPNDVQDYTSRDFTVRVILEQATITGSMKVNPYQSFDPLPVQVTVTPPVDTWSENVTQYTSSVTRYFSQSVGRYSYRGTSYSYSTETVSTSKTTSGGTLRQIPLTFEILGFGAGEILDKVTFDDIDVTSRVSQA